MLKLSTKSAAVQLVVHVIVTFLAAFGTALVAGATNIVSMPTLLALLYSAGAAGLVAVLHYVLGLIPAAPKIGKIGLNRQLSVPPVVTHDLGKLAVSIVATFVTILGGGLVAGATHVTSLPDVVAVVTAAISAAIAGVVQLVTGLISGA